VRALQHNLYEKVTGERPRRRAYHPIPSVWEGEDRALLELMLNFYPRNSPRLILDATVNAGRFWVQSNRPVIGLDLKGAYRPDVVGDNMEMPFRDGSFDVVVYDPPHIPNQGRDRSKDFNTRFGLVLKSRALVITSRTYMVHSLLKHIEC
jgi:hypothetical protein